MDQYEYIRSAHRVYNKAIREIARETGHDRKTIKKALRGVYPKYSTRQTQPFLYWGRIWKSLTAGLRPTRMPQKNNDTLL